MKNNPQPGQLFTADAGGPCCQTGRRRLLQGMMAATAGMMLPAKALWPAQSPNRGLIDVHRHYLAPRLRAQMAAQGRVVAIFESDTPQKMLADMDAGGVARSMLTLMAPPAVVTTTSADRAAIARDANEMGAKLVADNPSRFGFFASLPMPDVDASLAEIAYAFDTLKADGVQILTSYGNKWLGEPEFAPVYAELNRRKALIYTHPLEAACCNPNVGDMPPTMIEFAADTTRTIGRFVFSGSAARYPDINVIFSHGGGVLTGVMERFVLQAAMPQMKERLPKGLDHEIRRFYYDTAQAYHAATLRGLRTTVPVSQIVFGTDYPYRTAAETYDGMRGTGVFTAAEMRQIGQGNMQRLLGSRAGR